MSARDPKRLDRDGLPLHDAFLSELAELETELATELERAGKIAPADPARPSASELGLWALAESAAPAAAPTGTLDARARLLAAAEPEQRFERFVPKVAELLDVTLEAARRILARIDDAAAWTRELPGIAFMWVEGGPSLTQAVRGFVRVDAGVEFPHHEHLGEERVFVLQGGLEDHERKRKIYAGELDVMPAGTGHSYRALPDGPHLLGLAIMDVGIRVLGREYLASDER